ncbi:RimJ/RimL family protein N-acetyltransferase [Deinococcus metalli]|uniref:N-acetyltransferase n=1 Tax=Deinococcus metalli TaxID=1141878 RepID=A0A7W8NQ03_9DEIO|nr:GNAT family protein [Deinococcus metalli]MBB5374647.1 RimJ/RimL family protein N-acetyltransferase [Deinococcus metalli]GHF34753.1 N-acetyltransferase [Deinococcus metalli]
MTDAVPAADWLDAPTLRGHAVILEALTGAHAADLAAGADDETVRFLSRGGPDANTPPAWAAYIGRLNALPRRVNWAVRRADTGVAVGRISFSEVSPSDRWVEIGTMLLPAAQGVGVNPDAKLLLMTRAFEVLGANRVQFKVDARNARSLRAMLKLGAVQEGTLRQYQVRPDGYARDSVMFSVLRGEWPDVKAGLAARVAAGR